MKIRTEDEFQDIIDKETAWRKKELSAIKSNIAMAKKSSKNMALRAGIALLYAHWEGLVKNVASYYLCYVSYQNYKYLDLKPNFMAVSMKEDLKLFDSSKKASIHNKIIYDVKNKENDKAKVPYENVIKTKSNLNSDIFIEIMETIGLDYTDYQPSFALLDEALLKMRNEVAHGERVETISLDETRFNEIYGVVVDMMNRFITQITNSVYLKDYLLINVQ